MNGVRPWWPRLVALTAMGCTATRPTYLDRVRAATVLAREQLVDSSACSSHRAGTCANDPNVRFVTASDGFGWMIAWFDASGHQLAARSGNCVTTGPEVGTVPRCEEPDAGVIDLCEAARREVVVTGATVMDWPDGGFRRRECAVGRHAFDFGSFTLELEVADRLEGPIAMRLTRLDEGCVLREALTETELGPPLRVGDQLTSTELMLEARGGQARVHLAVWPRFEHAPGQR